MAKKRSCQRKQALQPINRKTRLTSDKDGAQKDNEIARGPQRKTVNGPRKDAKASEIA